MKPLTYIAFDAGCNLWEIEKFDNSIDWHKNEFKGTKKECKKECDRQMHGNQPHYPNAKYMSIHDY